MDATNDVFIATGCNYWWGVFKNYAVSLAQSGFRGRKVLFIRNVTSVARQTLTKLGFELIEYEQKESNVVIQRFKLLHDFLLANEGKIRFVIQSDIKDVVVQSDPSVWMEREYAANPSVNIWGASEFILYRNEFCNPQWVYKIYGEAGNKFLADEEVVCAGTIAGTAEAMTRLVKRIYDISIDRFGDDQAALNMLLRTEFKSEMRIPRHDESFMMTAGWWLIGDVVGNPDKPIGMRSNIRSTPPQLRNGVAYPFNSDVPYCIVHQYDRGLAWSPSISDHYKLGWETPEDEKPPRPGTRRRGGPIKYAKDGLTIDWHDQWVNP